MHADPAQIEGEPAIINTEAGVNATSILLTACFKMNSPTDDNNTGNTTNEKKDRMAK